MFNELSLKLFKAQNECTLSWVCDDGGPASTVVSFFFDDDAIWMTAMTYQPRVRALAKNPKASVVVSGKGSKLGDTRCVSMRGTVEVLQGAEIRDWFFPKFSKAVLGNFTGAKMMAKSMNNDDNVVLKFTPAKVIPYDAQKMMKMAKWMP